MTKPMHDMDLIRRAQSGEERARTELFRGAEGFVAKIARRYYRPDFRTEQFEDLMQVGFLGLQRALDSYDTEHDTGALFTTYATHWVWQTVSRHAVNVSGIVRRHTNKSEDGDDTKAGIMKYAPPDWYLDAPIKKDGSSDATMLELVMAPDRDEGFTGDDRRVVARAMAEVLTDKERDVLLRRLWHEQTLGEVASDYGVSRERIRQIMIKALKKLRAHLAPRVYDDTPFVGLFQERDDDDAPKKPLSRPASLPEVIAA